MNYLPSTLEPKGDLYHQDNSNEMYSSNTNSATEEDEEGPLKNFMSTRRLPSLNTLSNNAQLQQQQQQQQQQDDYIRLKLSGMSVCVSPNSPRGPATLERGNAANEYFPPPPPPTHTKPFDPLRSSTSLRRILHDNHGRRHSIANMDLDRSPQAHPSTTAYYSPQQPPQIQQPSYHHHASFPGHYSAPSSPPLEPTSRSTTPYHHPQQPSMRRNSSALIYREKSITETRRMSLNQYSRSSHIGKSVVAVEEEEEEEEERHVKDDMDGLYSRSPELRFSHKLAERKRRKEMKDLFEELKNALPVDKTLKTSKWAILTKAVEYISLLQDRDQSMEQELISLKQQVEQLKK